MIHIQMKYIPGTDYRYCIDNHGNITREFPGRRSKPVKWLRLPTSRHPYVSLCINGKKIIKTVPTLLAMAFIPNPNPEVYTHAICKNLDANDIRVENIEWATKSYILIRYKRLLDGLKKTCTSIYIGIYYNKHWYVELTKNGNKYKLGPFMTEGNALDARLQLEVEYPELLANV